MIEPGKAKSRPRAYDEELFARLSKGPMTAEQIGQVMGTYGPDALSLLRARSDVVLYVTGKQDGKKLYGLAPKI